MGSCPSDMGNCHAVRNRIPAFCSAHYADKRLFCKFSFMLCNLILLCGWPRGVQRLRMRPTQQWVFLRKIVILSKRKLSEFPVFG